MEQKEFCAYFSEFHNNIYILSFCMSNQEVEFWCDSNGLSSKSVCHVNGLNLRISLSEKNLAIKLPINHLICIS